jgi:mTERF domain-containing protein
MDLNQDKWFWPFEETMDSQEPRSQVLLKAPISSFITPELDLFLSLGMSMSHLARTLSSDPNFFTGSLENQIITKFHAIMSK